MDLILRPLTKYCRFNYPNGLTCITARPLSSSWCVLSEKKFKLDPGKIVKRDGTVIRKKTLQEKIITVFMGTTEKVLTMPEALKIADHKGLQLVKIDKPKGKSMDCYQLTRVSKLGETEKKKSHMKNYVYKVNIADNDLLVKTRNLISALNKYRIATYTVVNTSKDPKKTEELSEKIQKALSDAGVNFQIANVKGTVLNKIFTVLKKDQDPPPVDNEESKEKSEDDIKKS